MGGYQRKPVMNRDTGVEKSAMWNATLWEYSESELELAWISTLSLWRSANVCVNLWQSWFAFTSVSLTDEAKKQTWRNVSSIKYSTGELRCVLVNYFPVRISQGVEFVYFTWWLLVRPGQPVASRPSSTQTALRKSLPHSSQTLHTCSVLLGYNHDCIALVNTNVRDIPVHS